ncbi:hypothetical protein C8R46DRAFT_1088136 [Mycena filopes]|nr:hypothetical protein C8R46DRAFT_1088136 [Mycena filopes]
MSNTEQTLCLCSKPATNRCSACKSGESTSGATQTFAGDWKAHKIQCKVASRNPSVASRAAPVGSSSQLNELVRIGAQHTIYDDCMALGLNPDLISGASAEEFYDEKDGAGNFWRLEVPVREQWEAKAQVNNRKSQRFWTTYLAPISIGREWIDIVLDAVLNVRLPSNNNAMWQDQVNANILAGLFPHLRRFTPAQNTTLLDLFSSRVWNGSDTFRLEIGTTILFSHGQPTPDLVDQLVGRCLSWTRPYAELDKLLACVALPMQRHWPDIVGTRILDLAFAMLSPGRPGPPGGRTVPGNVILQKTSPTACKHLLPVLVMMFRRNMIDTPAARLLELATAFGITLRGERTDVLPWLMVEFIGDQRSTDRLDEKEGRLARFGIAVREYSAEELVGINSAAMGRLGNPPIL